MTLSADSLIVELLQEKPGAGFILQKFGMGCLGCSLGRNETIREAAEVHGIPLDKLLEALEIGS